MASLAALNRIVTGVDLFEWLVVIEAVNDDGQVVPITAKVTANTKSEARARVKAAFKGKFPPHTTITKTGRQPRQELMNATVEALAAQLQAQIKERLNAEQLVADVTAGVDIGLEPDQSVLALVSPGDAEAGGLDVHSGDAGTDVPAVAAGT